MCCAFDGKCRYKEDQAKLAKEEAEKRRRVEEQKARDAGIEEKRKEMERLRALEEAEEGKRIAERLELLAVKEAKVKESIDLKREQMKEEARLELRWLHVLHECVCV